MQTKEALTFSLDLEFRRIKFTLKFPRIRNKALLGRKKIILFCYLFLPFLWRSVFAPGTAGHFIKRLPSSKYSRKVYHCLKILGEYGWVWETKGHISFTIVLMQRSFPVSVLHIAQFLRFPKCLSAQTDYLRKLLGVRECTVNCLSDKWMK